MQGKLPPIGFWSYARQDEESARGKLSSLRARLQGELQQQYGRDQIRIFQDVAAIAPGDSWNRELHDAIQNSTFLVPIITPAFLESEWCCQEVRLFQAREAQLNADHPELDGRSRIFPIHYIDISNANPFDPDVLPLLQTRQWLDFRTMRFSLEDDPKVQMTLAGLAQGMNALLQVKVDLPDRPVSPPSPPPRPATTPRPHADAASRGDERPPAYFGATAASPAPKPWYLKPPALVGGGLLAGMVLIIGLALASDDTAGTSANAPTATATGAAMPDAAAPADAASANGAGPADAASAKTRNGYVVTGAKQLFERSPDSRSGDSGAKPIAIVFDNRSDDAVDLWWIDFDGKIQNYGTIPARGTLSQASYPLHLWELHRHGSGAVITALELPETGGTVTIEKP